MKPSAGINCKARINIIIGADGSCIINSLELSHNHTLSPEKSRFYRCNRALNPYIKKKLELNDIAGIRPNKSYRSIIVEAGGPENVPFMEKDCRNFLDKVRRLRLGEGDANAINANICGENTFQNNLSMASDYSSLSHVHGHFLPFYTPFDLQVR